MKYVSLDLETTSVDHKSPNSILMVSMVVEDTDNPRPLKELPHFTCFVRQSEVVGQYFALAMNSWILDIIAGRKHNDTGYPVLDCSEWVKSASNFLSAHFDFSNGIVLAGKNVATFDLQFLPEEIKKRFAHRVLDPAMLFIDFKSDVKPPSLLECKKRAGLEGPVAHDAREDALDVISVLRTAYVKD